MDYQNDRFGSAGPASLGALKRCGIIGGQGAGFGFDETTRYALRAPGDQSIGIYGGAGCGKSAGPFANLLIENQIGNAVIFDPRKELADISELAEACAGFERYVINPTGQGGASHSCNVLGRLRLKSASLIADTQATAMDLCPVPASKGNSIWVYEDAQDWLTQLLLWDAERNGCASLKGVYQLINLINGNLDEWCLQLDGMERSRFDSVRRFAGQIMQLQQNGREGFTAPLGQLFTTFKFMQDDRIAEALSGDDFSLQDLTNPSRKMRVYLVLPIEYLDVWAPAMRLTLGAVIQHKLRNPSSDHLHIVIDECGQLKNFPSVKLLYTFGRGAGLIGYCSWQEISQLYAGFGYETANEILGSTPIRVFKGIRTMETANLVSKMAGTMTLAYDPLRVQSDARRLKQHAVQKILSGSGGFLEAAADLRHYREAQDLPEKQSRPVFTPDEVLNLPSSAMIAFASGLVDGCIPGHWLMHFERSDLAGKYLGSEVHGRDRVLIKTRFGSKTVPVVEERVPGALCHLPQYQNGTWRYVQGYRPNF